MMLSTTRNFKFTLSCGPPGASVYQSSRHMDRTPDLFTLEQIRSNAVNTSFVVLTYNHG